MVDVIRQIDQISGTIAEAADRQGAAEVSNVLDEIRQAAHQVGEAAKEALGTARTLSGDSSTPEAAAGQFVGRVRAA